LRGLGCRGFASAATAAVRNWTLVTRNTADTAQSGVRIINPFEPRSGVAQAQDHGAGDESAEGPQG